jgi:hypothetical protein
MISESVGLSGRVKYEIDQVKPENESSVTGNKLDFGVGMIVFFTNLV